MHEMASPWSFCCENEMEMKDNWFANIEYWNAVVKILTSQFRFLWFWNKLKKKKKFLSIWYVAIVTTYDYNYRKVKRQIMFIVMSSRMD